MQTILINCTGKFCYRRGNFQNTEAAIKVVLTNFRKNLCQNLFLNKVAGLRAATLLKKRLRYRCFPVNYVKFLRTPFLQATVCQNMKAYV